MKTPDESERTPDPTPRRADAAGHAPPSPARSDAIETELSALEAILREEQRQPSAGDEGKADEPAADSPADLPVERPVDDG